MSAYLLWYYSVNNADNQLNSLSEAVLSIIIILEFWVKGSNA